MMFELLAVIALLVVAVFLGLVLASLFVGRGTTTPTPATSGPPASIRLDIVVADGEWVLYARKLFGAGYWSLVPRRWVVWDVSGDGERSALAEGEWTFDFRWQTIQEIASGPLPDDASAIVTAEVDTGMLGTLTAERSVRAAQ